MATHKDIAARVCMCIYIKILKLQVASRVCCACYLLHAGFVLGLFFDPEDVGEIFFRNVG
jgi:hypothetical protein